MSQTLSAPKQLNLKSLAMQAGLKSSGCPTTPETDSSGCLCIQAQHHSQRSLTLEIDFEEVNPSLRNVASVETFVQFSKSHPPPLYDICAVSCVANSRWVSSNPRKEIEMRLLTLQLLQFGSANHEIEEFVLWVIQG